jgi:putative transposase
LIVAHKIALDPNHEQETYFRRACRVARFAWNWALNEWQRQDQAHRANKRLPKLPRWSLRRQLDMVKRQSFPWMREVTKVAPQQAIVNLGIAFKNFFEDLAKFKRGEIRRKDIRRPKFKRKGRHDSFRADYGPGTFECDGCRIKLPVIGWVRMREALRFTSRPLSVTISRTAHRWFTSVAVEMGHTPPQRENQAAVGVDLGVKAMATLSKGIKIEGPKALRRYLGKLRRLSRSLSRKVKFSAKWHRAVDRLARLYARIANIRRDALHKATTAIVQQFTLAGIEDPNIRGMMANRRLARAIADVGAYQFRRQLEYKAAWHGSRIVVADPFFPSSKRCSVCYWIYADLGLSEREWTCARCGTVHDLDDNASVNLEEFAVSSTVTACGARSAGLVAHRKVKLVATKQEPEHEIKAYVRENG